MARDTIYDPLLALRPTSVMHQLGMESTVPLLNGRSILDGLLQSGSVFWAPDFFHPAMAGAILRAAAQHRALVGFSLAPATYDPGELRREKNPSRFFQAVVQAANEIDRVPPFVLHVDQPPVAQAKGAQFEVVRDHIALCLDAGFTSFGIDLSGCESADYSSVASGLLGDVLDWELCVSVRLDSAPPARLSADLVAKMVGDLKSSGIQPDLIILPGPDSSVPDAWALANAVAPLIAPCGIAWSAPKRPLKLLLEQLQKSFVRALIGGPSGALKDFNGSADQVDKIEALVYMEAMDVIEHLGGKDSGLRLVEALSTA
ncbi:MAG: hypothetical protein JRJ87_17200 [Deltaproteobacteria bacterium]|nr:hypothetical protein [Deltaproteobacteria bacterium]